jgi:flagellar hook-associated protein 1
MSISGSLSNALSGLTAAARAAEVVSSNVSNALTDGYGRRELQLASKSIGGNGAGVAVVGVARSVDDRVISERRIADAALGNASTTADFFQNLERTLGLPDDPNSVTGQVTKLETTLIEAASRPDSQARLNAVLSAATALTGKIGTVSEGIQGLRLKADQDINSLVGNLNQGLSRVAALNHEIRVQLGAGYDATALMDQRQQTIDKIADIVPLRQAARSGGEVALFTTGGAILLDGRAANVGFTSVATMVPQMTVGSGALSGLTINGQQVSVSGKGQMAGGRLAALFSVRDTYGVVAQQRLDAVARDLIERFADPAVDASLAATDPGLFTDAGVAFASTNEVGLSGRISVNGLADPAAGGAVWRLRDGLGAATSGDVGNSSLLVGLGNTLRNARVPASGGFSGAARSAVGLTGDVISLANNDLRTAQSQQSFSLAQVDTLKTIELRSGVDTDQEMQQLLLVEQSYSANARVISTIDKMIQTLLGL